MTFFRSGFMTLVSMCGINCIFVVGICIISYFQLFLNEFLNNPSLHERLAENINRTLSIKTTEKRSRKKSGKIPKIQENPKPNKPKKSEESTIPEESESNYSQNMESQGLYTFLDDILNLNVRRLGLFICFINTKNCHKTCFFITIKINCQTKEWNINRNLELSYLLVHNHSSCFELWTLVWVIFNFEQHFNFW